MSTKYLYEQQKRMHEAAPEAFPIKPEEEWIEDAINRLIQYLYQPDKEHPWGWVTNRPLIDSLGFRGEPINYGDLKCVGVEKLGDDGWLATVDEADPSCPRFCAWLEEWLAIFGWKAKVETEW